MKKYIIIICTCISLLLALCILSKLNNNLKITSYSFTDKYVYLLDNKSNNNLNICIYLKDNLKGECRNLFSNNQGVIVINKQENYNISDYNIVSKNVNNVAEYTDYYEEILKDFINNEIRISFTKNVDDNKRHNGWISVLLYSNDELVDVINIDVTFNKSKINHSFSIKENINDAKVLFCFW